MIPVSHKAPAILLLGVLGLAFLGGSTVEAQAKTRLDRGQVQNYRDARVAFKQGRYEDAVADLQEALDFGKANVLYANLGRALFRLGRCKEAAEAYQKGLEAPVVHRPSPELVRQKIEEYQQELQTCPGTVVLTCAPVDLGISIDGSVPQPCTDSPLELVPGTYTLRAGKGFDAITRTVEVAAMSENALEFIMPGAEIEPPAEEPHPVVVEPPAGNLVEADTWRLVGVVTGGAGLLTLASAGALEWLILKPAIDDFDADPTDAAKLDDVESLQSSILNVYVGGAALTAVGAGLFFLAPILAPEAPPSDPVAVTLRWQPFLGGVNVQLSF